MKMYTEKPYRRRKSGPKILFLATVLLAAGLGAYFIWGRGPEPTDNGDQPPASTQPAGGTSYTQSPGNALLPNRDRNKPTPGPDNAGVLPPTNGQTSNADPGAAQPNSAPEEPAKGPHYGPNGMTAELAKWIGPSPLTVPPVSADKARDAFAKGIALHKTNQSLLKARTLLNQAYTSGHLQGRDADVARLALEDLAARTVLQRNPYVNAEDPYTESYKWGPGESLLSKRDPRTRMVTKPGIIADRGLNVPDPMIVYVNGLPSATRFISGRSYKLIKGPFHVVIDKSERVADVYLQDLFVKRMPICIGAPETPTPEGYFRVAVGGRDANATYYPPPSTGLPSIPIRPGQPGYPLGPKGYNVKIEGIPELGTNITVEQSYALHGTSDPSTIGSAASRGCVRFGDKDIEFLYRALQDYRDPNDQKSTHTRWSTITIRP